MDAEAALLYFDALDEGNVSIPEFSASDLSCGEDSDGSGPSESAESDGDDEEVITDENIGGDSDDDVDNYAPHTANRPRERERSPLASRTRRGTGRGRGQSQGRGRGRGQRQGRGRGRTGRASAERGGRGSGRGRGHPPNGREGRGRGRRTVSITHSMWNTVDPNPQKKPEFNPGAAVGPLLPPDFSGTNEVDFFKLFFTSDLVAAIAGFTNAYANLHIAKFLYCGDKDGAWMETNLEEMYRFFALVLLMGLCKFPMIADYWSTKPLFNGSWARAIIPSRTRFQGLLCFFKVVDCFSEDAADRLKKVRFIYEHMQQKCRTLFQPGQSISVDERVVRSKARFSFRQYLPKKPVKWGTKVWALCDSKTSFCCNFSIYTGQAVPGQADVGLTQRVVQDLCVYSHNKGHVLYTDNFYTSGRLADALNQDGIQLVGTIRLNRVGVPELLRNVKHFDKHADRGCMRYERVEKKLYVQWKDRRSVTLLTTLHGANDSVMVDRNAKINGAHQVLHIQQPACIHDYNQGMSGVDTFDQHIAAYRVLRKTNKYWKTIAFDMLEVAVVNSYILFTQYRSANPGVIPRSKTYDAHEFRRQLICQLANIADDAPVPLYRQGRKPKSVPPQLITGPHLPRYSEKEKYCKYCYITEKKRRSCQTYCSTCEEYLHANHRECFYHFHHQ